ncbi:hypothetical protein C8J57DRAFT_1295082, partial [Mycena rebaudengoi]
NSCLDGVHIVLFIFSLRTLTSRNVPRRWLLVGTTIMMFLLGTCGTFVVVAMAGVSIRMIKAVVLGSADLPRRIGVLGELSAVADLLLLYRCYVIWGSKKILIVPALCNLATVVLTVVVWLPKPYIHPRTPCVMTLGTNLLLALLTAGRIWYVGREVQTYNTAIVLMFESGAIYCLSLVLWVISLTTLVNNYNGEFAEIFSGITGGLVTQTANTAPTLILVRVGMSRQWTQDTTSNGERLPSDDNIKFRIPVQPTQAA